MGKYDLPIYDDCRRWIQKKNERNIEWSKIRLACKNNLKDLSLFLKTREEEDEWPELTPDEWIELVDECEEYEHTQQALQFRGSEGALFDTSQDNGLRIPQNERSCWQLYKNHLQWKKSSIDDLENATIGILKRLSLDTSDTGPIKGLVIGHVQSGKTANMEALMAMAADHGWNMFIVLSGTIENLRLQTLKRMQKDLNHEGNLIWRGVEHPSKRSQYGERACDLHFEKNAQSRYFTVCLKNSSRLKKLIDWIHADKASHSQMKILIIDDEADQASINNSPKDKKERRGINKLIVDLVEDRHYKDNQSQGRAQAINYVMYTATPYANFLNECCDESLYPRHFIWTLKTSDEYIGPNQIFGTSDGIDDDGLDIKRIVSEDDLDQLADIYSYESTELPESMKCAICWFLCSVAVLRYWGYEHKPISMLIHTSQKQDCHEAVAVAISSWINENRNNGLIDLCEKIYDYETKRVTKDLWLKQIKNYGISAEEILDYPDFSKISGGIELLLNDNMQHIKMSDEGNLQYNSNLHLVIDNCSKNGLQNDNDYVRLAYPDPDIEPYPEPAPAFIIIGGNTLSRGLTIEGLVSTFFLRASCQADTLMQMGRWFGYRRGYEMLPRIWMTSDTIDKYRFLSQLEIELRDDLKKYMHTEVTPMDYGPRILCSPKVSWLRITSRNHMQGAVPAEVDFSGARPQTVIFDNNKEIQERNIQITENFLRMLPGEPFVSYNKKAIFWKNISLATIMDNFLIDKFSFSARSRVFNEIDTFCSWIKEIMKTKDLDKWSVIVAGKDDVNNEAESDAQHWNICGWNVGKVNRSRRDIGDDTSIDIGALRALSDCVADIDKSIIESYIKINDRPITKQEDVDNIRVQAKMDNIPVLIIYRIDKNSKAYNENRKPLNAPCDIIGIHICIPGDQVNKNFCKRITIQLPASEKEDEVEG